MEKDNCIIILADGFLLLAILIRSRLDGQIYSILEKALHSMRVCVCGIYLIPFLFTVDGSIDTVYYIVHFLVRYMGSLVSIDSV